MQPLWKSKPRHRRFKRVKSRRRELPPRTVPMGDDILNRPASSSRSQSRENFQVRFHGPGDDDMLPSDVPELERTAPTPDSLVPSLSPYVEEDRPTTPPPGPRRPSSSPPDLKQTYLVRSLLHVINEAITEHAHCLPKAELDLAERFRFLENASVPALYIFARLYNRKHGQGFAVDDLTVEYGLQLPAGETVADALAELVQEGLLLSSGHATTSQDRVMAMALLLQKRSKTDVVQLWKITPGSRRKGKLPGKKKMLEDLQGYLRAPPGSTQMLISERYGASQSPVFTHTPSQDTPSPVSVPQFLQQSPQPQRRRPMQATLTSIPVGDRLARKILRQAGEAVRIPDEVLNGLQRLHLVVTLSDRDNGFPHHLLAFEDTARYPAYECKRVTKVFPSRAALAAFEHARDLERAFDSAKKKDDLVTASRIGAVAEEEVRKVYALDAPTSAGPPRAGPSAAADGPPKQSHAEVMQQLRHPFFRRYTALWVYLRTAWHSVQPLEKSGNHEAAARRLELILKSDLTAKRRGQVLDRLTINLDEHLGRKEEAMKYIVIALRSSPLPSGDRLVLAKRAESIHSDLHLEDTVAKLGAYVKGVQKRKKMAKKEIAVTLPKEVREQLQRLTRDIPERKFFKIPEPRKIGREKSGTPVSFKSLKNGREISVEGLAMEWYSVRGEWYGAHVEGKAFQFLFSLLMWKSGLFAQVDDVFHAPFQTAPLDLKTEVFYSSRKQSIDTRLLEIEAMTPTSLEAEVISRYEEYCGTNAVGCLWKSSRAKPEAFIFSKEDLGCIAGGIGSRGVARICKLLAKDYSYWSGGICDVVFWKREEGRAKAMLVEVKSAKDTLSARQQAWIRELLDLGVKCEVFKVVEKRLVKDKAQLQASALTDTEFARLQGLQP